MSCEFCERADFGNYRAEVDNGHAHISLAGGSYRFPKNDQFAFCPMCGDALSDPRPLTLGELRERDGRPVWVVEGGNDKDRCGRALVSWDGDQAGLISLGDEWYPEMAFYGMEELGGGLHVLGWLAYDREPKEDDGE